MEKITEQLTDSIKQFQDRRFEAKADEKLRVSP